MAETGKKERRRLGEELAIIAGVVVFTVSLVFGDYSYTDVYSPPAGEATQAQILSQIYGGSFTQTGVNYSNGTISALRVYDHDDEDIRLDLLNGDIGDVDKVWTDGVAMVTAKVKYAQDNQSFGWNQGGLGTDNYEELLTHNDIGQESVILNISGDFLWGYMPNGEEWWSYNDLNYRQEDHLITYKVEGLDQPGVTWLLFMEDRPFVLWEGCRWVKASDRDYNDFVVEINAIPEPATICLLAIGALLLRKRS